MRIVPNPDVFKVTVDPLEGYEGHRKNALLNSTGLIPYFVAEAALTAEETTEDVWRIMDECYGFPSDYNSLENGGEVTDEGVYTYPGDPTMKPLVEFTWGDSMVVWVYEYAMVCVFDGETKVMKRMD